MKEKKYIFAALLACGLAGQPVILAEEKEIGEIRTIRLLQDDAQVRIASKLYELQYVKATDIRPYIEAAVKRYHAKSAVERVNYSAAKKNALIVSTGEDFLPYVDDLIAQIDRPGKKDEFGSVIEGTGITRIAYTPNYRGRKTLSASSTERFAAARGLPTSIKTPISYTGRMTNWRRWQRWHG